MLTSPTSSASYLPSDAQAPIQTSVPITTATCAGAAPAAFAFVLRELLQLCSNPPIAGERRASSTCGAHSRTHPTTARPWWIASSIYPDLICGRDKAPKPARCQRITVSGLTTANTASVVGTNRDSQTNNRRSALLRARSLWRHAPEHVDLLAKNQDLRLTPRAGLEQSNERTTKQFEQLDHRAAASPDSHRFASCMEFPTRTACFQSKLRRIPPGGTCSSGQFPPWATTSFSSSAQSGSTGQRTSVQMDVPFSHRRRNCAFFGKSRIGR